MKTMATARKPASNCACSAARIAASSGALLDRAVGEHALVDLDDVVIELLGLDDLLGEDVGPRLVADAQRVAETPAW